MSVVTDPSLNSPEALPTSARSLRATPDEALKTLLPRYARLGLGIARAEACLVRVRRGDQRWQSAGAGTPDDADEALCDRTCRAEAPLREGRRYGLPIGQRGALVVRLGSGEEAGERAGAVLDDLVVLLAREVGGGTERAAAAEAARAAAVEVEHQMRNGFAKINAMIDLAAREGLPQGTLVEVLKRRLAALSEANEVAITHGFGPAPVEAVVRAAFAAVLGRNQGGEVVRLDGEHLLVTPAVASVLAPIFGELVEDALRRGTLRAGAPVRLSWRHQAERERVFFRWEETVPSDAEPFGSAFLRSGGPNTLRAEALVDQESGESQGATYCLAVSDRFVSRPPPG